MRPAISVTIFDLHLYIVRFLDAIFLDRSGIAPGRAFRSIALYGYCFINRCFKTAGIVVTMRMWVDLEAWLVFCWNALEYIIFLSYVSEVKHKVA